MSYPAAQFPTFPANPLEGSLAPVGGLPLSGAGGYLIVRRLISEPNTYLLDVSGWRMLSGTGMAPVAKGGMLGATSMRRTGYSHMWQADVILDLRLIPKTILFREMAVEILFRLGEPTVWGSPRYLWLPRAVVESVGATATATARTRCPLAGSATAHAFVLPDEGDPADPATRAGAYKQWLGRNET